MLNYIFKYAFFSELLIEKELTIRQWEEIECWPDGLMHEEMPDWEDKKPAYLWIMSQVQAKKAIIPKKMVWNETFLSFFHRNIKYQ